MNRNFAGNVGIGGATPPIAGGADPIPAGVVDPLLSDREAAAVLGCARSSVWRWVNAGILPKPLKIGGMSRWRQSDIEAVIAKAEAAREPNGGAS